MIDVTAIRERYLALLAHLDERGRRIFAATEHGQGQHHQRDMTVPAVPGPGFIVVQSKLGLGHLKVLFNSLRSYSPRYRAWNLGCSAQ
jgi:hypothetical protein